MDNTILDSVVDQFRNRLINNGFFSTLSPSLDYIELDFSQLLDGQLNALECTVQQFQQSIESIPSEQQQQIEIPNGDNNEPINDDNNTNSGDSDESESTVETVVNSTSNRTRRKRKRKRKSSCKSTTTIAINSQSTILQPIQRPQNNNQQPPNPSCSTDLRCEKQKTIEEFVAAFRHGFTTCAEMQNYQLITELANVTISVMRLNKQNEHHNNNPTAAVILDINQMKQFDVKIQSVTIGAVVIKKITYFLHGCIAHLAKQHELSGYIGKMQQQLGYASHVDITGLEHFYSFIYQFYPTECDAAATNPQQLLTIPLFYANISWTRWKQYLTIPQRPILECALNQFNESIINFQSNSIRPNNCRTTRECC